MSDNDINKAYVSPHDEFLFKFDAEHEKSESQIIEIKKHLRIAYLRDNADAKNADGEIWEDF